MCSPLCEQACHKRALGFSVLTLLGPILIVAALCLLFLGFTTQNTIDYAASVQNWTDYSEPHFRDWCSRTELHFRVQGHFIEAESELIGTDIDDGHSLLGPSLNYGAFLKRANVTAMMPPFDPSLEIKAELFFEDQTNKRLYFNVSFPFMREVHLAISSSACSGRGTWNYQNRTCTIHQIATEICVKVSRQSDTMEWLPSDAHGGLGCGVDGNQWFPVGYTDIVNLSLTSQTLINATVRSVNDPLVVAAGLTNCSLVLIPEGELLYTINMLLLSVGGMFSILLAIYIWRFFHKLSSTSQDSGDLHFYKRQTHADKPKIVKFNGQFSGVVNSGAYNSIGDASYHTLRSE